MYYKGNKFSHTNHLALMSAGTDELFLLKTKFPLPCPWLVIVQSRYPVFYRCRKVVFEKDNIILCLTDNRQVRVKPYLDGVQDRLLVNEVYSI